MKIENCKVGQRVTFKRLKGYPSPLDGCVGVIVLLLESKFVEVNFGKYGRLTINPAQLKKVKGGDL